MNSRGPAADCVHGHCDAFLLLVTSVQSEHSTVDCPAQLSLHTQHRRTTAVKLATCIVSIVADVSFTHFTLLTTPYACSSVSVRQRPKLYLAENCRLVTDADIRRLLTLEHRSSVAHEILLAMEHSLRQHLGSGTVCVI